VRRRWPLVRYIDSRVLCLQGAIFKEFGNTVYPNEA
jgi:hypothetical protein